ncbi:MAG: ABC transporter substrate-binding protein [Oscillospiraceae bacterium]|nr:ABC transporter substrate-binding protein [Oscillospiraceae bacterium]
MGCANHNITPTVPAAPKRTVAASGSFAQLWLLAGGALLGTTEDAFENGVVQPGQAESVGALHSPSLEKIIALQPDLVLLSSDISAHAQLKAPLEAAGIAVRYFSVEHFADYLDMLKTCTELTGDAAAYQTYGLDVQTKIDAILARPRAQTPPRILFLRASAGKVSARGSDTMAGAMLRDLGCVNITDSDAGLLEDLSLEVILQADPDYIFATTMGGSDAQATKALEDLFASPAWGSLTAVQTHRYALLPKELFHQKPNERWAESYELLWEALYAQS